MQKKINTVQKSASVGRKLLLMLCDAVLCVIMAYVAMLLRFAPDITMNEVTRVTLRLPFLVLPYLAAFIVFGIYRVLWRYADYQRLMVQALAACVGMVVVLMCNAVILPLFWPGQMIISRYMIVIHGALVAIVSCGERMLARMVRESRDLAHGAAVEQSGGKHRALIVGAGMGGNYAIMLCQRHPSTLGVPVAMVDDAPFKRNMRINNVAVVGGIDDIPDVVKRYSITDILIAIPSLKGERMAHVVALCNSTKCRVQILSDPEKLPDTDDKAEHLSLRRPNAADFLSRDEISLDSRAIGGYLMDKVVMVTGGGGSIGSEICRQVMAFSPRKLIVFDIYENGAYELECELRSKYGDGCCVEVVIGSIRDRKRLDAVIACHRPQVVFHAAAHKHVPLMENSPAEAVKNNIFGTRNMIEAAAAGGVKRFVQISSDKAVNPTNVMGATKRATEMLLQYYSHHVNMQCMAVRFGNVLGSHGSVIPLFEQQIASGGPVTITHPEITRYFMTIPEAAQLVLQAGSYAESGCIYVLDMGEPVRIMDLAKKLIRFYGLEPEKDIDIRVTSLRPGEKLFEELMMPSEAQGVRRTAHDKIMVVPDIHIDESAFVEQLERIRHLVEKEETPETTQAVIDLLEGMVPTFHHEPIGQTQAARGEAASAAM